jgi:hypothetical protein
MSSLSTTNICGTDHDFDRPSGTAASLNRYPGTSCLATISLSLRDKSHSPIEAPLNYLSAYEVSTREDKAGRQRLIRMVFAPQGLQDSARVSTPGTSNEMG